MQGHVILLLLAGAGAGFVNAIAGGGTLLTFPALLLAGMGGVQANATSTVALIVGIGGSVYGYRGQMRAVRSLIWEFTPCSLLGGLLGGILLTLTPPGLFDCLVPFLVLFATLLFMGQGLFARCRIGWGRADQGRPQWPALLLQFFIALYGGYFGAGIGILMLATLGFIGLHDIHEMNAVKTILGGLINIVAALYFMAMGLVDWGMVALLALGALPGYYVGSMFSQSIPPVRVRQLISLIGLGIAGVMFYRRFIG